MSAGGFTTYYLVLKDPVPFQFNNCFTRLYMAYSTTHIHDWLSTFHLVQLLQHPFVSCGCYWRKPI